MNYRGFTLAELEQEYSPSSMIGGDLTPQLLSYRALSKTARERLEVKENLPYGPDPAQVLDFFPATQAGAPLHIFVHGGYWQALNQRDSAMMAPAIVKSGAAFATLNYTLAPEARLSQMIAECRDALLWLASQAGQLGFDPTRVVISGHSAGAHLVAMLLSKYGAEIAEAGLTIERVILISGVYDLEPIALTSVNEPLQLSRNPGSFPTRVPAAERAACPRHRSAKRHRRVHPAKSLLCGTSAPERAKRVL